MINTKAAAFGSLFVLAACFQNCSQPVNFAKEEFSSERTNGFEEILRTVEPVMAVRASGCITCHANISSGFVTDFGFGSPYFLGQGSGLAYNDGSIYGDHGGSWKSAKFGTGIVVPATPTTTFGSFTGTLADYVRREEGTKAAANQAPILEASHIYIGAPSAADLMARFKVAATTATRFIRHNGSSKEFSGLTAQPGGYYRNSGELVCDGDFYVNAPVLLDSPVVRTRTGCRIYSTRTIFLQGSLTYINDEAAGSDKTNLQLVSARAIIMGVGTSHCESASYDGRYNQYPVGHGSNPLFNRMKKIWTHPSHITRESFAAGRTPAQQGQLVLDDAALIPGGVQDASCFVGRREVDLERLLVNAPNVQSRYRGAFKGVMIAEVALGSLSKFTFQFDEVFKSVPVLPVLEQGDFLDIR